MHEDDHTRCTKGCTFYVYHLVSSDAAFSWEITDRSDEHAPPSCRLLPPALSLWITLMSVESHRVYSGEKGNWLLSAYLFGGLLTLQGTS